MAVRVDRPGTLCRDYHTVGAGIGCLSAQRKVKVTASTGELETFVTERFYLCDASFLVALSGPDDFLKEIHARLASPAWPPYLGRKSCPPSVPILSDNAPQMGIYPSFEDALKSYPWQPRLPEVDAVPFSLRCVLECEPTEPGAVIRFDCPQSFAKPRPMDFRYVKEITVQGFPVWPPAQNPYREPQSIRADYESPEWKQRRLRRGVRDSFCCLVCGMPSYVTHHITYRHVQKELLDELRSVCRRCHDAITMLEYEEELDVDRIDPVAPGNRERILARRRVIDAERTIRLDPERR
jgi:hypothetical protein